MADVLRSGLAWLTQQLATHAAQEVVYQRGEDEITVRATFGEKLLKLESVDGGIVMEWTDLDFCIPAEDLAIDGVPFEPRRGDRIVVAGERTYEVLPIGTEPPWRWADPHRSMVRVHTKHITPGQGYS